MIHAGHVHGPQHPIGDVGRSWNLKKMPSSVQGHLASFPGLLFGLAAVEYHYSAGLSPARPVTSMHNKAGLAFAKPKSRGSKTCGLQDMRASREGPRRVFGPCQVLTTFRCVGEFD